MAYERNKYAERATVLSFAKIVIYNVDARMSKYLGPTSLGSRSLSLFIVPLRLPLIPSPPRSTLHKYRRSFISLSKCNAFEQYIRSPPQEQIGTHPVPTTEVSLNGAKGYLIGFLNEGIKTIYWVSLAFILLSCPSQVSPGVFKLRVLFSAIPWTCTPLTFGVVCLLERSENGNGTTEESAMLRLFALVAKGFMASTLFCSFHVNLIIHAIRGFMLHGMIQDTSVEKIRDGTANVLALDVIRPCTGGHATNAFSTWGMGVISQVPPSIAGEFPIVESALATLQNTLDESKAPSTIECRMSSYFLSPRTTSFGTVTTRACLFRCERGPTAVYKREFQPSNQRLIRPLASIDQIINFFSHSFD
ncbi:hypothetical protein BS47DRAFT_1482967 [Hydnum rufescens UP504]|uniref:Uncharacterized protein n=1 Tax=Hydnum rufescens UP504 TaxID=1448309 RepID=A0A9P6B5Z3_9AGAM|nr:hypothetical protein BS47DRAFT_1482967 [Hydnum rufescens UP504]